MPTIATACDSVRHAAYLGGYCAANSPLSIEPLPLMVPKGPLRQSMDGVLMISVSDHAPFSIGLDHGRAGHTMSDIFEEPRLIL